MSEPASNLAPTQCTATANHGGRCRAKAIGGKGLCRAHSMSPDELDAMRERSARIRRERAESKAHAVEQARIGTKARLALLVEEMQDELVAAYRDAIAKGDTEALERAKASELLLSRVLGRPTQPTSDVTPELPADVEALRAMSPEERRALLQSMPPLRP